jgi:hypothetical protein
MLAIARVVEFASGPITSAFLAFVTREKPRIKPTRVGLRRTGSRPLLELALWGDAHRTPNSANLLVVPDSDAALHVRIRARLR